MTQLSPCGGTAPQNEKQTGLGSVLPTLPSSLTSHDFLQDSSLPLVLPSLPRHHRFGTGFGAGFPLNGNINAISC